MVKPKKHLGQHFLNDNNIAQNIVNALQYNANCTEKPVNCIEIGPGTGVLTKYLIQKKEYNLHLIEIDNESVTYLQNHYSESDVCIHNSDFLKMDIHNQIGEVPVIIGNFPYNISSQIFFKVLENKNMISEVVCMIQKEVAERIASKPGPKAYGILSVLLQAYYDIEYLFTVNEHVFIPPPKVKSGVIRLTRNSTQNLNCNEKIFLEVVKKSFNQRRKTLRNSLKPMLTPELLTQQILNKRPEQLSVEEFVFLTNMISGTI